MLQIDQLSVPVSGRTPRHDTRKQRPGLPLLIVQTLPKARNGVGVSRNPAKRSRQDNSPDQREGQPTGNSG